MGALLNKHTRKHKFMTVESFAGRAVWDLNGFYHTKYGTYLGSHKELCCCSIGMAGNDEPELAGYFRGTSADFVIWLNSIVMASERPECGLRGVS